ncbi:MAG: dihydrofolate reductase family protein [Candidatus Magasanikbacteria bacterium]|nr:dihydrofolate reductase family protein [Candidatus Magasanikbacteria bacterium]
MTENPFKAMHCTIETDNRAEFPGRYTIKLPPMLREIYGGDLDFVVSPEKLDRPVTFLNFVTDTKGVFNRKDLPGGGPISKGNEADAFGMALLRAVADGVMVGAGTVNGEPDHKWHVDFIFDAFPQMKGKEALRNEFKQWRKELGKQYEHPPTFFMTNSGQVNFDAAVFKDTSITKYIVTGAAGALALRTKFGMTTSALDALNTSILVYGDEKLDETAMMKDLRANFGIDILLHEGGRGVADALVQRGLIDQLFLTQMAASIENDTAPENLQYLLSTPDHQLLPEARVMTTRNDAAHTAKLIAVALAGVPKL